MFVFVHACECVFVFVISLPLHDHDHDHDHDCLQFNAPELIQDRTAVADAACDVWSFAVVAWQLAHPAAQLYDGVRVVVVVVVMVMVVVMVVMVVL